MAVDITITVPTAGVTKALAAAKAIMPAATNADLKTMLEDAARDAIRQTVIGWTIDARREEANTARRDALADIDVSFPAPVDPEPEVTP